MFDAIVCDYSGEIKVIGFNEEVDRLYNTLIVNQVTIKIVFLFNYTMI